MDADKPGAKKRALVEDAVPAEDFRRVMDEVRHLRSEIDALREEVRSWRDKALRYERRFHDAYDEASDDNDVRSEVSAGFSTGDPMDEDLVGALPAPAPCAMPAQKALATPARADVTCAPPAQKTGSKPAPVDGPCTSKGVKGPNGVAGRRAAVPRAAKAGSGNAASVSMSKKSMSVPVITVFDVNVKNMTEEIKEKLGHSNFVLRIINRTVVNVSVLILEDYNKVKELLIGGKVGFYTYTPKGLTPFSVVVYGLSDVYTEDVVKDYLGSLPFKLHVQRVVKLGHGKWLVHLTRESDIDAFYLVKGILNCRVAIKKDTKKKVTQCHNCQRFGHVSSNCGMPFRCVKCSGNHGPGKCTIPSKE